MRVELTGQEKQIVRAVDEFCRKELNPLDCLELEKNRQFPMDIYKKACQLGFIASHLPESAGGQDIGLEGSALIIERLCRHDSTVGSALALCSLGPGQILCFSDDSVKSEYLKAIAEGQVLCGTSSIISKGIENLIALPLLSRRKNGSFELNGSCQSVINGGFAGLYTIACRMPKKGSGPGKTFIAIVRNRQTGIFESERHYTTGLRTIRFAELMFDNCLIAPDHVLEISTLDRGARNLLFGNGWVVIAAIATGIAQGAFDLALDYARKRKQFGRKLIEFQALRHRLSEMTAMIHSARLATRHAAALADRGGNHKTAGALFSLAKMTACRAAVEVSYNAIQLLGGYGYMSEYHVERFYRDAKTLELCYGTPDHLKEHIGSLIPVF